MRELPVCHRLCSNDAHLYDPIPVVTRRQPLRGVHFCESLCPTGALVSAGILGD